MRLNHLLNLVIIIFVLLITHSYAEPVYEIMLKSVDYGYIVHVEHVPRPRYHHRSLTASEIARELLLDKIYGENIDESLLTFLLRCRRKGYFSRTPAEQGLDLESTFYVSWLFKTLGVSFSLDKGIFEELLCNSTVFIDAFYSARILMLLGEKISSRCFNGWDLGYAVSWVKGSNTPSIEATRLFLLVFDDDRKAKWLYEKGAFSLRESLSGYSRLDYSKWYNIELLIINRPVFVNATIFPKVIVDEKPKLVEVSCIEWPNRILNHSFSYRFKNNIFFSKIKCSNRVLEFKHAVSRSEYASLKIVEDTGKLYLSTSYKPPFTLKIFVAGLEYKWDAENFDFNTSIDLPAYGSFKIKCIITSRYSFLIGEKTIYLNTSYERRLIDYGFIILPLLSSIIEFFGSRRKFRYRGLMITVQSLPLPILLLINNPLTITFLYGVFMLLITFFMDREAFRRSIEHTVVVLSLSATSMAVSNPLILLLGGFGSTIFLISAILYPSEIDKTERFYKSTMLLYSLGTLAMTMLNNISTQIATLLYVPESGFIEAVKTQTKFISNLFSLTPVIAPIYHLTRLIHSYERARDAKYILKRIVFFKS